VLAVAVVCCLLSRQLQRAYLKLETCTTSHVVSLVLLATRGWRRMSRRLRVTPDKAEGWVQVAHLPSPAGMVQTERVHRVLPEHGNGERLSEAVDMFDVPAQRVALEQALGELADAHAELARRQSFTDALLETIDVGIVSCDAQGVFVVSNRAERAMFGLETGLQGLSAEQIASRIDVFDLDGRRLGVQEYPLVRALHGEDVTEVDVLVGPAGGPHRGVVVRGSQITGPDGEVLGAVAALTDVTVERTAARALAEERRKLTEAQRLGQLGSFEHDFATGIWTFSEQLCALWGVEPGSLLPELTQSLVFEQDRHLAVESWGAASRLGGHRSYEYRIRRASDGAERLLRCSIEVELGPDGQPSHGRGTHLDITDLSVAEKAAQRANAFFDAVLTATPDYTFVTSLATGAVIYGSRGEDALGLSPKELEVLGPEASAALIHPEDQHRLHAVNSAASDLEDGQVLQLRYRGLHADRQWRWLNRRVTPFRRDSSGRVIEVLGVVRDVTDVVQAEDLLTYAALHDNLPGLPNRALLVDRLDAALARSGRDGREVAVLFCDLDGFKRVNDTGGHAAGDAVLLETARRLNSLLRKDDTIARVGGDEFVIVVEPWNRSSPGEQASAHRTGAEPDRTLAVRVARRVAGVLRQPITINGVDHVVTASIGITYAKLGRAGGTGAVTAEEVLQDADAAMYWAKGRGKDRFEVFEHGLRPDQAGHG
jgi:diguanylate cyclase (GGDEF)-like protein/PAS domain S-box-containing protein